ncbi:MAG: type II toxin-antitoxin system ParD family antitoxin [Thermodesulfobacteriota bacterium]
MSRKTISMPDDMSDWIDRRIKSGQYNNDSEYFRDLIRRDQERQKSIVQLQKLLEEGENSGVSERKVSDIMKDVEDRLQKDGKL